MSLPALTGASSSWVFISDSDAPRHLHDIVFCVDVLRKRGVVDARISVATNHLEAAKHLAPFGIQQVLPLEGVAGHLSSLPDTEAVTIVVTGHGRPDGVGADKTTFTPHALMTALRSVPGLATGVIILAQCYAGVFNYLPADEKPQLVILGATNLNVSISMGVALDQPIPGGESALTKWSANFFLVNFFRWVQSPSDVDGDGQQTLMDAYKYAGTHSNQQLVGLKSGLYLRALDLGEKFRRQDAHLATLMQRVPPHITAMGASPDAASALASAEPDLFGELQSAFLDRQAIDADLGDTLTKLHSHQEPWILNARLARQIVVG